MAQPTWWLTDTRGEKILSGQLTAKSLAQGKITSLGKISIDLGNVKSPQKLTLTLQAGKY